MQSQSIREPCGDSPRKCHEGKSPEGAHLGNTHAKGVADASSSGDRGSVSNSASGGKGAEIRESRSPVPAGTRILDDNQTKGEKFQEKFLDRLAPVKSVQDEIGGVKEPCGDKTSFANKISLRTSG